jgi:uracil-DNA glycosylase
MRAGRPPRSPSLSALYNENCRACFLHDRANTVCVPASGDPRYRVMVVGEAPGAQEDAYGVPFVGEAGRILDTALVEAFLTERVRHEVVVTNVVKCRPPGNRTPTEKEIETCTNLYLVNEIEIVDPLCILALGNAACDALLGQVGITSIRGTWHRLDREKMTWVMPTYHPMYVTYQRHKPEVAEQFQADVNEFAAKWIALWEN